MKCNKCGSENPNNTKFCSNCGASLVGYDFGDINANVNLNVKNETTERILDNVGNSVERGKGTLKKIVKFVIAGVILFIIGTSSYDYIHQEMQHNKNEKARQEREAKDKKIGETIVEKYFNNGNGRNYTSKDGQTINFTIIDISSHYERLRVHKITINGREFYNTNRKNFYTEELLPYENDEYSPLDDDKLRYSLDWYQGEIVAIRKMKEGYSSDLDIVYLEVK